MKSRLSDHIDPRSFNSTYIPTDFTLYAKNQVNGILKNWIDDQAVKRVYVEAITIDGKNSLDLDDAIWAERTNNWYCIWVHIADVTEAIPIFSPLDREALQRTTSIYRKDHILNMFPKEICNGILTLDENGLKKTMTLQMDLDLDTNLKSASFYESTFKNLKRYNYESFWEDYENADSPHYSTIHLLKEITDKLRENRKNKWWIVWYRDDDRRLYIWWKDENEVPTYSKKMANNMIEALMVQANTTTGDYLIKKWADAIFKHHEAIDERSFYSHNPWFHKGLWVNNYTHFTSPIRRYVDDFVHRILKAIDRWEEIPYNRADGKMVSELSNNTRLKVDALWSQIDYKLKYFQFYDNGGWIQLDNKDKWKQIDHEDKWSRFLMKTTERLWQKPEVYHLKDFIRLSVDRWRKLPQCMREAIKEKINSWHVSTWIWMIGVILFWKDNDIKKFLKEKLLSKDFMGPMKILNVIAQTQILSWNWDNVIFKVIEKEEGNSYEIEVLLHDNKLTSYSMNEWWLWSLEHIKWIVRRKVIARIFDYFIDI